MIETKIAFVAKYYFSFPAAQEGINSKAKNIGLLTIKITSHFDSLKNPENKKI